MSKLARIIFACVLLSGCGGRNATEERVSNEKAYSMGQQQAAEALEKTGDIDEFEDFLLETQARISEIRRLNGDGAAQDYQRGFEDAMRESDDSLARQLF